MAGRADRDTQDSCCCLIGGRQRGHPQKCLSPNPGRTVVWVSPGFPPMICGCPPGFPFVGSRRPSQVAETIRAANWKLNDQDLQKSDCSFNVHVYRRDFGSGTIFREGGTRGNRFIFNRGDVAPFASISTSSDVRRRNFPQLVRSAQPRHRLETEAASR